jgi:uncharacterized SAM-binding protein YcdF (DUF218 family)
MRRFVLVCLVILAAAYVIGVPWFLLTDDDPLPEGADAVVVLSGPDNLLTAGQTLVGGGIAPTLVVSASRSARGTRRANYCRAEPEDVVCLYAGPFSTPGEAQAISELAQKRNWDTVVLVTTQVDRQLAERVFRRCGDFRAVAGGVDQPWWRDVIGVPLEWLKLGIAETVRRGC